MGSESSVQIPSGINLTMFLTLFKLKLTKFEMKEILGTSFQNLFI